MYGCLFYVLPILRDNGALSILQPLLISLNIGLCTCTNGSMTRTDGRHETTGELEVGDYRERGGMVAFDV